jgi:CBS domain containing-hemolysin-like protein
MIPRNEIQGIDVSEGLDGLKQKFIETQLSRLIVYDDAIDHVLGYAHHQSLWKAPKDLREMLFHMSVVPESMPALDALTLMMKERTSISLVVEEFGGTAGIITLEDILEEIFGEIRDEHDEEEFTETRVSDHEYVFSGRLEVDYLNDTYGLSLPRGDYETLAGLIMTVSGKIPQKDERVVIDGFEFTIVRPSKTRIETVRVEVVEV